MTAKTLLHENVATIIPQLLDIVRYSILINKSDRVHIRTKSYTYRKIIKQSHMRFISEASDTPDDIYQLLDHKQPRLCLLLVSLTTFHHAMFL